MVVPQINVVKPERILPEAIILTVDKILLKLLFLFLIIGKLPQRNYGHERVGEQNQQLERTNGTVRQQTGSSYKQWRDGKNRLL